MKSQEQTYNHLLQKHVSILQMVC